MRFLRCPHRSTYPSSPRAASRRHNETATPNNGYVDGQLIFNFANSQNVSYVFAPYRKNASTPVWNFETIYRFNPDGTGIEEFAKGAPRPLLSRAVFVIVCVDGVG